MSRPQLRRVLVSFLTLLFLSIAAGAASGPTVAIHVASLEAFEQDVLQLSSRLGDQPPAGWMLQTLNQMLGVGDLSWIDRSRPLAVVMPPGGMLLGDKGFVSVLPAADTAAALAAIEVDLGSAEPDPQGIRRYLGEEELIVVAVHDRYLVVGRNGDLVRDIDLDAVLNNPTLPAGSIAVDVNVKELSPMIMMGIQAGRQMLSNELAQAGEEGDEEPEISPELARDLVDLYFELITDLVNNTSRIQFSAELTENELILHKRIEPADDSTLAGLIDVQKGGLPELARYIEPGDDFMLFAGQVNITPALRTAINTYFERYLSFLRLMIQQSPTAQPLSAWIGARESLESVDLEKVSSCYDGRFAGTFGMEAGGPFHMVQIYGVEDQVGCQEWMDTMLGLLDELDLDGSMGMQIELERNALGYRGATATRQVTHIDLPVPTDGAEDVQKLMEAYLGDQGMISYFGFSAPYMIQTMGTLAEDDFKRLVDKTTAKKKKQKKMVGLKPEHFAPLSVGPGVFGKFNAGKLMQHILSMLPAEYEREADEMEWLAELSAESVPLAMGARFDDDALVAEMSISLRMFDIIKQLAEADDSDQPPAHTLE